MNRSGIFRIRKRYTKREWRIVVAFYFLLLQNPLGNYFPAFNYIDELFSLYGIVILGCRALSTGKIEMKRKTARTALFVLLFVATGVLGNLLFQYQPIKYVLIDILANLKFFLAIISGYVLFYGLDENNGEYLLNNIKFSVICIFLMLLLDQIFHIFRSPEIRYGLRVSQLIYGHPTYLAGAMVFLLLFLLIFYRKHAYIYMYMCVIILFFTLRGKAIAGGAVYALLVYFVLIRKKRMRVWHFLIVGAVALVIGWEQLQYYYAELEGQSARSVLTLTSLEIMKDYFPIGTGFATYASAAAAEHYSPVYVQYGFMYIHELGGNSRGSGFFSDTFWPIIIGQTGVVGMLFYVSALASLMRRVMSIRKVDECAYVMGIFVFIYLFISSTSESAFHNPLAVPLAALLGYVFTLEKKKELYL